MTLLVGVLVASLLGSLHCGAMCSAFACLATRRGASGAWYHGGRLLAYVTLGSVAGRIGAAINGAGAVVQVQRAATVVTAVLLTSWGAYQLVAALRQRTPASASRWAAGTASLLDRTRHWDPRMSAASVGLITGLLPCGWLWAFIATALGTGTPLKAATVMMVFWIGTVPMLVAFTAGARRFGPLMRVRWPLASASLVLVLGVSQLLAHLWMPIVSKTGTHAHASAERAHQ
jgi:uncharacterized protein